MELIRRYLDHFKVHHSRYVLSLRHNPKAVLRAFSPVVYFNWRRGERHVQEIHRLHNENRELRLTLAASSNSTIAPCRTQSSIACLQKENTQLWLAHVRGKHHRCSSGILSSGSKFCCLGECGMCGGPFCSERGEYCCGTSIAQHHLVCESSEGPPPCMFIDDAAMAPLARAPLYAKLAVVRRQEVYNINLAQDAKTWRRVMSR